MRVVFFGTPEFAVPSLLALIGEGFEIVAVVTQPDKPKGRSRSRTVPPPVKLVAQAESIPVLQPENPSAADFVETVRQLAPDIGVVIAYGHILRQALLTIPKFGMVNVHASLLPKLRGAAPIHHAILDGFTETGVSVMQMDEGMDTGPVHLRVPTPIAEDETCGELSVRLAELGALSVIEALTLIGTGHADPEPQDDAEATRAPKINRDAARIDWAASAASIARHVRAMDPVPGAWTELNGQPLKLFGPTALAEPATDKPAGTIVSIHDGLVVGAAPGAVRFLDVQPAGKNRMSSESWIRGRGVTTGTQLS